MSTFSSTHVDVEDIESTKSEKLLAFVLAAFMLVGALWGYQQVDDTIRAAVEPAPMSAADRAALERQGSAAKTLRAAEETELAARDRMELAREAYRTALDADAPARDLELAYDEAQAVYTQAQQEAADAQAEVAAARGPAAAAQERIDSEQRWANRVESVGVFGSRLVLALGGLAGAFLLLARLRARGSRYLPVALAAVGASALVVLVMAGDYVTNYVDPLEFGPLVLSVAGIALTLLAFVALQRYLAKRAPLRRLRKGECPFCAYPGRGASHCEGCGHSLVAECGACSGPRRVGALHCGACGST